MQKYLFIILGTILLGLGLLGVITPGLPTTPFIMLTAYLYMRSSPRLHEKLKNHRITGKYLNRVSNGLSLKGRLISIGCMWIMVCITAFLIFDYGKMRFIMLGLGAIGTIAQLIVLRKRTPKTEVNQAIQNNQDDEAHEKTESSY